MATGGTFSSVESEAEIGAMLGEAGPGAQGIVGGFDDAGAGHVYNAINYEGQVLFIDNSTAGTFSQGLTDLYFLPTNF